MKKKKVHSYDDIKFVAVDSHNMNLGKAVVYDTNMSDDLQQDVINTASAAMQKF